MAALDPPVGELIIPADTTVKGPCCGALGLRISEIALAGVAQWIECQPVKQRVIGSISSQGICLGCRPGPPSWCVRDNHTLMFLSLSLSFSLPNSLSKSK